MNQPGLQQLLSSVARTPVHEIGKSSVNNVVMAYHYYGIVICRHRTVFTIHVIVLNC